MYRPVATFLAAMCAGCSGQDYVVVSVEDGPALLRQCTRATPTVDEFWAPNRDALDRAEQDLHLVQALRGDLKPDAYFRQYIGVTVANQRLLYLNAVEGQVARTPGVPDQDLSEPIVICDGGLLSWGALYDPANRRYFELAVNEVGG